MISRCTPTENSQFAGRWPQPVVRSLSYSSPGPVGAEREIRDLPAGIPAVVRQRIQQVALRNEVAVGSRVQDRLTDCVSASTGFGLRPMPFSV